MKKYKKKLEKYKEIEKYKKYIFLDFSNLLYFSKLAFIARSGRICQNLPEIPYLEKIKYNVSPGLGICVQNQQ